MRSESRIKKVKESLIYLTISIILLLLIIVGLFIKNDIYGGNIAEAVSIVDTLGIMKDENPLRVALYKEIKLYEKTKLELRLETQRKTLQDQRILKDKEEQMLELKRDEESKSTGRIAYLTFDDGPSMVVTPQILDILREYDIKATFFVIGSMAEKYPEILKKTYVEGHIIGNHSYSHNYGYIYKNSSNYFTDLNKANIVLKSILGQDFQTNIIRFPGGSFGKKKSSIVKEVKKAGYNYFDWNALNGDAEGVNLSKETLISRFKETVKNKKELIILMHDTDSKITTVESLREIIDYLINKGYIFSTLDDY